MLAVLWLAIAIATLAAIGLLLVRPWHARWGATEFDVRRAMPGDDAVPFPFASATRALTVEAPPDEIWPWVLELVQTAAEANERHWIERLIPRKGRGSFLPPREDLQVGEVVNLGPPGLGRPLMVQQLAPGRHLLLGNQPTTAWCLGFYPVAARSTRLVLRTRVHRTHWPARLLDIVAIEPGAFLVARKILTGVKDRVESAATRSRNGAPEAKGTASV
jgi:hypothetical protein